MRYRGLALLCALLILLSTGGSAAFAQEPPTDVQAPHDEAQAQILVVYLREAGHPMRTDSLAFVAQTLFSLGIAADYAECGALPADLSVYEGVIWCAFAPSDRLRPELLRGYTGRLMVLGSAEGFEDRGLYSRMSGDARSAVASYPFENGTTAESIVSLLSPGSLDGAEGSRGSADAGGVVVPLAAWREGMHYVALSDYSSDFARAILAYEISDWRRPDQAKTRIHPAGLCINELYPFTDPARLADIVNTLVKKKTNFTLCVMPIYQNTDYPAMERFCEVLRYAQANGGSIILHAPIIQNGLEGEALAAHLTEAALAYTEHGVYPLALAIPSAWLFSEAALPLLGRYSTLFLLELDAFETHTASEYSLRPFLAQGCRVILPAFSADRAGAFLTARYASTLYLDPNENSLAEIERTIELFCDAPFPTQNLWATDQAVQMDDGHTLLWENGELTVDGEQRFPGYTPAENQENFDYKRNVYYRFVADLANQNHLLIGFSAVMLVVFLLLVVRSRLLMHRQFLRYREKKKEDEVPREQTADGKTSE